MVPETNFPLNQKPVWLRHWIDIEMSRVHILPWLELSLPLHLVNGRRLRVTIYFSSFLNVVTLVWKVSFWICPVLHSIGWIPLFISNTKCFLTLPLNLNMNNKANVTYFLIPSSWQKQRPYPKWLINLNTNTFLSKYQLKTGNLFLSTLILWEFGYKNHNGMFWILINVNVNTAVTGTYYNTNPNVTDKWFTLF